MNYRTLQDLEDEDENGRIKICGKSAVSGTRQDRQPFVTI